MNARLFILSSRMLIEWSHYNSNGSNTYPCNVPFVYTNM